MVVGGLHASHATKLDSDSLSVSITSPFRIKFRHRVRAPASQNLRKAANLARSRCGGGDDVGIELERQPVPSSSIGQSGVAHDWI